MVGYEPADALDMPVGVAKAREQVAGDGGSLLLLKSAVLTPVLHFAGADADVVDVGGTFEDEEGFRVEPFALAYQPGVGMNFGGVLNALGVAVVVVDHGESQFLNLCHCQSVFTCLAKSLGFYCPFRSISVVILFSVSLISRCIEFKSHAIPSRSIIILADPFCGYS